MNKEKLTKVVNETLGFNPEEMRYKQEELTREIAELKAILKNTIPTIGRSILELHLLQEYLKQNNLDATEYIDTRVEELLTLNHDEVKNLSLTTKAKDKSKKGLN